MKAKQVCDFDLLNGDRCRARATHVFMLGRSSRAPILVRDKNDVLGAAVPVLRFYSCAEHARQSIVEFKKLPRRTR